MVLPKTKDGCQPCRAAEERIDLQPRPTPKKMVAAASPLREVPSRLLPRSQAGGFAACRHRFDPFRIFVPTGACGKIDLEHAGIGRQPQRDPLAGLILGRVTLQQDLASPDRPRRSLNGGKQLQEWLLEKWRNKDGHRLPASFDRHGSSRHRWRQSIKRESQPHRTVRFRQDPVILAEAPTRGAPAGIIMVDGDGQDLCAGIIRIDKTAPVRSNSQMPTDIVGQVAESMWRKRS